MSKGTRRASSICSSGCLPAGKGPPIETARAEAVKAGITINGLAVLCRYCSGQPISYDLETAFAERIIGGPAAFVITADNPQTFSAAVRRKLILEIAGTEPPARFVARQR